MRYGRYRFIGSMLVVPLALYAVFVLSPYAQSIYISFTQWSGFTSNKQWVGLSNYRTLIHDDTFWTSVEHNLIALIVLPVVTVALGLFFATMLNVGGKKGKAAVQGVRGSSFYKVVYFFPYVLSIVVIGVLWSFIYDSTSHGLLNGVLGWFGGRVDWLGDTSTAFWAILVVMIWTSVGFYVVLFSAAMGSIPTEMFEAALLDGSDRWRTFWRITLPLMWDSVQVGVIYIGIQALDLFALVSTMSANGDGGPDNSTQVMANYLYINAFSYNKFGYATAMGVALLILTLVMAGVVLRFTRRERLEF
ncbi:MAG: sugar ABC transporter permease [Mycobacterium sp.]|nr:sugar ABC transporter permease [Mycobacterium sp.]